LNPEKKDRKRLLAVSVNGQGFLGVSSGDEKDYRNNMESKKT